MIIDTHCHAGKNWFLPIESLEFEMDRAGVEGAVLIQHGGTYDNDYLFEESGKRNNRFKVVVLVDPEDEDPIGSLEKLAERGAAGIRIGPDDEFNFLTDATDIWRKAGDLNLVVSSIGDDKNFASDKFKRLVDSCPNTSIVIEHLAGVGITTPPYTNYEKALEISDRPNTSIKVPGLGEITPRPNRLEPEFQFHNVPPLFEMAYDAFGADRMMWGSDYPPSAGREGYQNTLEGVRNHPAFAKAGDTEWILGKTAERVWGF